MPMVEWYGASTYLALELRPGFEPFSTTNLGDDQHSYLSKQNITSVSALEVVECIEALQMW